MPDGRVHNICTAALAAALPTAAAMAGILPANHALALSAGCLVGLLISPDLDVDRGNISHHIVRRSFGCFPGALWTIFWLPYARIIPHRSWVSHAPLVGTLLRLGYLTALPVLLYWLVSLITPLPTLALPHWRGMPYAVLGLAAADTLHTVMDSIWR